MSLSPFFLNKNALIMMNVRSSLHKISQPAGMVIQKLRFLQLERAFLIGGVRKTHTAIENYICFHHENQRITSHSYLMCS